ncbi:MAG: hypothetical protein NVS3B21_06260 [Acidimicrobiales bacterium]
MFGFLAQLLAWCYDLIPNYAIAITLFTVILMAAVTPFTIKSMRSAAEMARLQPEIKKLQDQYKNDKIKQNEEMQALFKEHGVNPLGGCIPALLPMPIFFIIFRLLRGMTARKTGVFSPLVRVVRHQIGGGAGYVEPHYIAYKTSLHQHIVASDGHLRSFGMDLAQAARDHHSSWLVAIPFYALIVIMTITQYWQQRQMNIRNPQAAANQQTKLMMQIFPAFYALISLSIPASVVVYLLISGLFRMAQQTLSYRFDPVLARPAIPPATIDAKSRPVPAGAKAALTGGGSKAATPDAAISKARSSGGLFGSLREAANQAKEEAAAKRPPAQKGSRAAAPLTSAGNGAAKNGAAKNGASKNGAFTNGASTNEAPANGGTGGHRSGTQEAVDPPRNGSGAGSPLSVRPSGRAAPPTGGGKRSKKGR